MLEPTGGLFEACCGHLSTDKTVEALLNKSADSLHKTKDTSRYGNHINTTLTRPRIDMSSHQGASWIVFGEIERCQDLSSPLAEARHAGWFAH